MAVASAVVTAVAPAVKVAAVARESPLPALQGAEVEAMAGALWPLAPQAASLVEGRSEVGRTVGRLGRRSRGARGGRCPGREARDRGQPHRVVKG